MKLSLYEAQFTGLWATIQRVLILKFAFGPEKSGAPNENIVHNHLNIELLNVF